MSNKRFEKIITGVALSPGIAVARICLLNDGRHSDVPEYTIESKNIVTEIERFYKARATAMQNVIRVAARVRSKIGEAEGGIFDAHVMILEDPQLQEDVEHLIKEKHLNAESAIAETLDNYEVRLLEIDDEYIRERATDFGEIKRRLLDELGEKLVANCGDGECQRGHNRIVVAEELTPQLTVDLDTDSVMGFVTERGGVNAHGAILARALGVPAVSGLSKIRDMVSCGTEILINGTSGEVVLWPRERTVVKIRETEPDQLRMPTTVEPVDGLRVMSNISMPSEIKCAVAMKSEGIGLYRTEIELITGGSDYCEDCFYDSYYKVFCENQGAPIAYRMFDIGSDKKLPGLNIPNERNPALGLRGARLLMKNKDLLKMQARALARVSVHGNVSVTYPMIVDKNQFLKIKQMFNDAISDMEYGQIKHGVMFEVPSACLLAEEIMEVADFGSIGTNDLVQYMFAVDRDNELLVDEFSPDHQVLWKMLELVSAAGKNRDKTITVCGELAGDPRYIGKLIESGVSAVSVSVRMIPAVRTAANEYFKKN